VDFRGQHPCELGLEKYVRRIKERLLDAIVPNEDEGETPLLPILNRYKPIGTTAEVDFVTKRPCVATTRSHVNQVVADRRAGLNPPDRASKSKVKEEHGKAA